MPAAAGFHGHQPHVAGALVCGGFVTLGNLAPSAVTAFHDGTTVTNLAPIGTDGGGTAIPSAAHTMTPLYDGTFLIYGGGVWPNTIGDGWIYTPQ